jgi:hypothetical protein
MGHTGNKVCQAKVWQKSNKGQQYCGRQTLAWQSVAKNQTAPSCPEQLQPKLSVKSGNSTCLYMLRRSILFAKHIEYNVLLYNSEQ